MDSFTYLNELRIGSSCGASWERMEGGYRERFCSRCEKRVHDFRRLTPAEIDRRIGAHRGGICARLTRDPDGDLVFLGSAAQVEGPGPALRRAPPAAAYLLTALLGAASASAQSPADAGTGIESSREPEADGQPGELPDELPTSGAYAADEELTVAGELGDIGEVTMGVLAAPADPLPVAFSASPLVVLATVAETKVIEDVDEIEAEGGYGEVETELEVDVLLKGTLPRGPLRLRYFAYLGAEGAADDAEWTILPAGSSVLALLEPSADDAEAVGEPIWRSLRPPRTLTEDETDAYRVRLEALASLLSEAESAAGSAPAPETDAAPPSPELIEWLVGTAEEPLTRTETVDELDAVEITQSQRERLVAALVATRRFAESDLALFDLVREWAPEESQRWLREAAGEAAWSASQGAEPLPELWLFQRAAEALGEDDLRSRIDAAQVRIGALYDAAYAVEAETGAPSARPSDAGLIAAQDAEAISRDLLRSLADELLGSSEQEEPPVR